VSLRDREERRLHRREMRIVCAERAEQRARAVRGEPACGFLWARVCGGENDARLGAPVVQLALRPKPADEQHEGLLAQLRVRAREPRGPGGQTELVRRSRARAVLLGGSRLRVAPQERADNARDERRGERRLVRGDVAEQRGPGREERRGRVRLALWDEPLPVRRRRSAVHCIRTKTVMGRARGWSRVLGARWPYRARTTPEKETRGHGLTDARAGRARRA
jgi:hypothetical protein